MAPAKGTANRRGAARREEILDAAIELFAERGYRGSGILELAERVGITHAGVLHHFGTKENLLRAVVARRDEVQTPVTEALRGGRVAGIVDILATSRPFIDPPILTRLTTVLQAENLNPGDPLHDYFDLRMRLARAFFADELRAALEHGEVRADLDPDLKAAEILAFIMGVQVQWLMNPDLIDPDQLYAAYARSLVEDLERPAAS